MPECCAIGGVIWINVCLVRNIIGRSQRLSIHAGPGLENQSYWVLGSATSTTPGFVLGGIHTPIRPDIYTGVCLNFANSKEFTNFNGKLSATGTASASLNIPAGLPVPRGFKLYHSYVVVL